MHCIAWNSPLTLPLSISPPPAHAYIYSNGIFEVLMTVSRMNDTIWSPHVPVDVFCNNSCCLNYIRQIVQDEITFMSIHHLACL
jgi:hypothetical protein